MYAVVTCIIQPFAPQGRQAGARYMPHTHVSTKVRMYTWRETYSQCYPYLLYVVPVAPRKHTRTFSTSRVAKTFSFSSSLLSSTLRIIPSLQGKDFHGSYTEQYRCHCMGGHERHLIGSYTNKSNRCCWSKPWITYCIRSTIQFKLLYCGDDGLETGHVYIFRIT